MQQNPQLSPLPQPPPPPPHNNNLRRTAREGGKNNNNQCQTWYHGIKFYHSITQRKHRYRRLTKKNSQAKPSQKPAGRKKKRKQEQWERNEYHTETVQKSTVQQYKYKSICVRDEERLRQWKGKKNDNHLNKNFPRYFSIPLPSPPKKRWK